MKGSLYIITALLTLNLCLSYFIFNKVEMNTAKLNEIIILLKNI